MSAANSANDAAAAGRGALGAKVKQTAGSLPGVGGDFGRLLPPSIVTPALRAVGKLAASVATISTNARGGGAPPSLSDTLAAAGSGGGGSATGNPRNRCVLAPGHSLMDWIRLGNSGRDLTGVGDLAGTMTVSPEEIQAHNRREDAWIAIRGNVYNVTEYLAFHPGGVEELMRGVGLPDATALFDEVHPWVNYDKMLTKCYVGRLCASGSLTIASDQGNVRFVSPEDYETEELSLTLPEPPEGRQNSIAVVDDRLVRYDWIQKHDIFILYFYTGQYSNPFFDIRRPLDNKWTFVITFVESVFTFKFAPHDVLVWPPRFKVFYDTGKIEVGFEKQTKKIWPSCGTMDQSKRKVIPQQCKKKYMIREHVILNKYTFMMSLQKADLSLCNTPLGYHVVLYNDVNDSREYTPVPHLYIKPDSKETREDFNSPFLTFVIRRYNDGRLSNFLYNKKAGDTVLGSDPTGVFDLQLIADKRHFLILSGGTGLTPFLGIVPFLLEKKVQPVSTVMLVNFNPTQQHQFLLQKLAVMAEDPRFAFLPVLTQPAPEYEGVSGHLTMAFMRNLLSQAFSAVPIADIYFLCCGTAAFNTACFHKLNLLHVELDNMYFFTATAMHPAGNMPASSSEALPEEKEAQAPQFARAEAGSAPEAPLFVCCLCIPVPRACVQRLRRAVAGVLFGRRRT